MNSPKFSKNEYFETVGVQADFNYGFIHDINNINGEDHYVVTWQNFPNKKHLYKCSEADGTWTKTRDVFKVASQSSQSTNLEQNIKSDKSSCSHQGTMKLYKGFLHDDHYCTNCGYVQK